MRDTLHIFAQAHPAVALSPDQPVGSSAFLHHLNHTGAVGIVEDEKLVGIFTERDMLKRVIAQGLDIHTVSVRTVMTPDPVTIDINATISDAIETMVTTRYRYLPIMDRGAFTGMLDIRDTMPAVKKLLVDQKETFADLFWEPYACRLNR